MTRLGLAVVVVGLATVASGDTQLSQSVQNALTSIDTVPTQTQLDDVFAGAPQAMLSLATIALDASNDVGIRLRAIHALAKYCVASPCTTTDTVHQAVAMLVTASAQERVGSGLLVLRASIEALGLLRVATDVDPLVPLLDHPSRDVRAATAHALRDICNQAAITPLRMRYQHETTEQVKLAIAEAVRLLGQCP